MASLLRVFVAFGLIGSTSTVFASIFPGQIANGVNEFQDQSREIFIDADGSGAINAGDVIVGFVRIDDQLIPPNGPVGNQLYGILTQQFASDPTVVLTGGGFTVYDFAFEPTTLAGFTMPDLLGALDPGGVADGMVALLQADPGFSLNLITQAPNAAPVMTDFISLLTSEGTLVGVAGILDSDDNFIGQTSVLDSNPGAGENDFVADLSVITTNPQNFQGVDQLATYEAGLSILYNGFPEIAYNEFVASSFGTHQLVVSGPINGALDLPVEFAGTDYFPFIFSDRADLVFNATVVPEPTAALVWLVLAAVSTVGITLKRQRIAD